MLGVIGTLASFTFYWKVLHWWADYHAGEWRQPEGSLLLPSVPLHWATEWDHLHLLSALHHPTLRVHFLQHLQGRRVAYEFQAEISNSGQIPSSYLHIWPDPQQCQRKRRSMRSTGSTVVQEGIAEPSVLTVAIRTVCLSFFFCRFQTVHLKAILKYATETWITFGW